MITQQQITGTIAMLALIIAVLALVLLVIDRKDTTQLREDLDAIMASHELHSATWSAHSPTLNKAY